MKEQATAGDVTARQGGDGGRTARTVPMAEMPTGDDVRMSPSPPSTALCDHHPAGKMHMIGWLPQDGEVMDSF